MGEFGDRRPEWSKVYRDDTAVNCCWAQWDSLCGMECCIEDEEWYERLYDNIGTPARYNTATP